VIEVVGCLSDRPSGDPASCDAQILVVFLRFQCNGMWAVCTFLTVSMVEVCQCSNTQMDTCQREHVQPTNIVLSLVHIKIGTHTYTHKPCTALLLSCFVVAFFSSF
jgi:hypothetical protein